jgi:hypothetical protein
MVALIKEDHMRRSVLFFALTLLCFMTTGAEAVNWKVVQLQSTPSRDQLLATCRQEGGHTPKVPVATAAASNARATKAAALNAKMVVGARDARPLGCSPLVELPV